MNATTQEAPDGLAARIVGTAHPLRIVLFGPADGRDARP
jgi:hypothetical protein